MSQLLELWKRFNSLKADVQVRWKSMSRVQRLSGYALAVLALYLAPWWPKIPGIGWLVNTPGTQFSTVLNDQVIIFVLVALGRQWTLY
jgi:hypothetical protein